jgi:hypothetical protein
MREGAFGTKLMPYVGDVSLINQTFPEEKPAQRKWSSKYGPQTNNLGITYSKCKLESVPENCCIFIIYVQKTAVGLHSLL